MSKTLARKIANEPVVHIAGTVSAVIVWLFTYVVNGWDPNTHQQQIAGLATALAYGIAFIARQYVTPTAKIVAQPPVVVTPSATLPAASAPPAA